MKTGKPRKYKLKERTFVLTVLIQMNDRSHTTEGEIVEFVANKLKGWSMDGRIGKADAFDVTETTQKKKKS